MDSNEWRTAVGALLKQARGRTSKRKAAQRAGFSEALWRQLEDGYRTVQQGVTVPVNPRDDTLEAAAKAVGLDPAEVFRAAGRPYEPLPPEPSEPQSPEEALDELRARVRALEERAERDRGEKRRAG